MSQPDAVMEMLTELRGQRPPIWDCDARENWLASIGAFITSMSNTDERVKAIQAVALDLRMAYGMHEEVAHLVVAVAVFSAEERD